MNQRTPDFEFAFTDKELALALVDYLVKTNRLTPGSFDSDLTIGPGSNHNFFKLWKRKPCV